MRADLHEVLIERPRGGQRRKTARGNKPRAADWIDEDSYGDSYAPRRIRTKWFDDLLSPLRRWLRSQVDRPWNKVWSELAQGIDARSMSGRHLLDHVRDLVTIDAEYDATRRAVVEKPHVRCRRREDTPPVEGLYVDPRTGILRWRKPSPRRVARLWADAEPLFDAAGQPVELRRIAPSQFHLKCGGIWFDVDIASLTTSERKSPHDIGNRLHRFRITRKRQLNSRELLAAGLNNDA